MNPRLLFLAVAIGTALWACSAASKVGIEPPVNTNIDLTSGVQTGAAAMQDPPYGSEYGMGGKFQPFTVPGF
jgi:hypothetical protein